jgi:hypothetical protein
VYGGAGTFTHLMNMPRQELLIYPNGIDGTTGEYLATPNLLRALSEFLGRKLEHLSTKNLRSGNESGRTQGRKFLGLPLGIDPLNVQRAGWGIVFSTNVRGEVRESLNPLIELRRRNIPPDRFKILEYREGESVRDWLKRHNVSPGNITPTRIPFYLLLIGHPTEIPFEFQYLLSIEYAVGRLGFDEAEDYSRYALSIRSYETHSMGNRREVLFWSPRHDRATELSSDFLVGPLTKPDISYQDEGPVAEYSTYRNHYFIGEQATKQRLGEILNSAEGTSAMLFTASHGLGWPSRHELQKEKQGALICQEWKRRGIFNESCYFDASDITDEARLSGLVVFSFACYSAGTPTFDTFAPSFNRKRDLPTQEGKRIAETPFVAALPQRMLSHPRGCALAFIGHVDRAWGFSIKPPDTDEQLIPFRNCIARILKGEPVGLAMRDFTQRYAMLSASLLNSLLTSKEIDLLADYNLVRAWIECNDAQSYIILGDPAAQVKAH